MKKKDLLNSAMQNFLKCLIDVRSKDGLVHRRGVGSRGLQCFLSYRFSDSEDGGNIFGRKVTYQTTGRHN